MDHPSKNELRGVSGQKKCGWLVHIISRVVLWSGELCIVWLPTKARPGEGGGAGLLGSFQSTYHGSNPYKKWLGVDEQKRSVVGLLTLFLVWNLVGLANWVSFDPQQEWGQGGMIARQLSVRIRWIVHTRTKMRGVLTGKKKGGWLAGIISWGQGGMLLGSFQSYVRWIIHTTNETSGVDGQKRSLVVLLALFLAWLLGAQFESWIDAVWQFQLLLDGGLTCNVFLLIRPHLVAGSVCFQSCCER